MTRRLIRAGAAGVVAFAATGLAVFTAAPANAAVIGSLTFAPPSGTETTAISVTTSGTCPGSATNLIATVTGTGFPASGQVAVANIAISAVPQVNGGYQLPLAGTMRDLANLQSPPAQLSGNYTFTVTCRTAFNPASLGDFTGQINFTSNTTYVPVVVSVPQDTTTTLAVSPPSTATSPTEGQAVTLTATVTATPATPAVAGTVQFFDGATPIGGPQNVSGGTATLVTSTLAAGDHSLTAAFTGASADVHNSTSSAVAYHISPAVATVTSTALAVSPASGTADNTQNVTLTATVTPAAAGTVTFKDGATSVGTAPVSGGTAVLTRTYAAGNHSFTATFDPANPAQFTTSTSTSLAYVVTAFAGVSTSETVNTTVAPGQLTISVANANAVVLPTPVLNAAATLLTTSGDINPVTVTDTRAGDPGWTLSGQISDFAGPGTASINGWNLGWTPKLVDNGAGQTVTAGGVVNPAPGIAPGATPTDPALGLKTGRTLARTTAGHGIGTAHVSATLALNVPTTTVAGTYSATLTLTAI